MEKPTLEEVKEHFKNAKVVRCLEEEIERDLTELKIIRGVHELVDEYWIDFKDELGNPEGILLYENGEYAEIIEYKIDWQNLSLEEWLDETRKLNLSEKELQKHIDNPFKCNKIVHYRKLQGHLSYGKAEILYNKWNNMETKEQKLERLEKELQSLKQQLKEERNFKVGDIVKLVSKRSTNWASSGKMDKYLSKLVKLSRIADGRIEFSGSDGWYFYIEDIERKATQEEIEEFNKLKLPKIGCREGEINDYFINYGDKEISKTALREMQRAGITEITIVHKGETFRVNRGVLERIYKVVNR